MAGQALGLRDDVVIGYYLTVVVLVVAVRASGTVTGDIEPRNYRKLRVSIDK